MNIISERKILVIPDLPTATWVEKSIRDIAASRGTKSFGRGNLLAACGRALAEVRLSLEGCRSEAHVTALLVDVLTKGMAAEGQTRQ